MKKCFWNNADIRWAAGRLCIVNICSIFMIMIIKDCNIKQYNCVISIISVCTATITGHVWHQRSCTFVYRDTNQGYNFILSQILMLNLSQLLTVLEHLYFCPEADKCFTKTLLPCFQLTGSQWFIDSLNSSEECWAKSSLSSCLASFWVVYG